MDKVKITVLKCNVDEELAKEYACKDFGVCHLHKAGQVFYSDWTKPEGLCDDAWYCIHYHVFALLHGGGNFYDGHWMSNPETAVTCCNDGLRPVVFKLERVSGES